MKKYRHYLTTIAIIMLLGACSNDPIWDDRGYSPGPERTISLTAKMPGDNPTTRVALEQDDDLTVILTWEEGDQLELVFVQEDLKIKETVTVDNISSDGITANFNIEIPSEITSNFDLYGVYGGGGLSEDDPTIAILPTKPGETGTLPSIEEKKHVMFYFALKDMKVVYSEHSVEFKNFGSLFNIMLRNTGTTSLDGLAEARLIGVGGDGKWAYNIGEGGGRYDLVAGKFLDTEAAGNYLSFKAEKASLPGGEFINLWGWYPPLPEKVWPELELHLLDAEGEDIAVSVNTTEARTEETAAGKSYYFNALWDGAKLEFGVFKTPDIYVKATGVESNDGTSWDAATTLTRALEIAEEGDNIHIAAGTYIPTKRATGGDKEGDVTFEINQNVTLIGGYPANASPEAIPNKANETILSGNKKSYHTVTITAPKVEGKKVILKNLYIKDGLAGKADDGSLAINGVNYNRSFGGGMSIGASVVDVIDCVIADNESGQHVGGVYVHNGAIATFKGTDIKNNKAATNCGGILNAATTHLIECNVLDNESSGVCGGIYNFDKENGGATGPKLYIYNTTVAGNKATSSWAGGGGLYAREGSHTEIVNSTFYENKAAYGGAIRVYTAAGLNPSSADIISSTFYKNNATGNGGGIETQPGTTVNVYNSIITGNTAPSGKDKDVAFAGTFTISYTVLGDKVLDEDGNEIAGKTFDHTSMISALGSDGTCMISGSSPAAHFGMDAELLKALALNFTPPIEENIITKDQIGNSRFGKNVMGAVVPAVIEEPTSPDVPRADMLDVVFNVDGTAEDLSPMRHTVRKVEFDHPFTVSYNETYKRNMVTFNPSANGQGPGKNAGSYYRIDYAKNGEFELKLANGHTFETLVKFDVDYSVPRSYETKFFSTHEQGGTGFLVASSSAASGGNGITFLPNVSVEEGGASRWIWANSKIKPDGASWYHLVGVWDKDAGKAYLYVNGEKKSEVDAAGFYRPPLLTPPWLAIGGDAGSDQIQNPFAGSLAIARIYDKALTEEEAKALWDQVK